MNKKIAILKELGAEEITDEVIQRLKSSDNKIYNCTAKWIEENKPKGLIFLRKDYTGTFSYSYLEQTDIKTILGGMINSGFKLPTGFEIERIN